MACCAFIAFLVSQVYLLAAAPIRRLRGAPRVAALPAGAWRLAAVGSAPAGMHAEERRPATAPATARHGRPWLPLLMVGTVELALVVGAGQWFVIGDGRQRLEDELNRVAGIHTLGDLKDLCAGWRSGTSSSP